MGTQRMMSEESTNPDLVELTHRHLVGYRSRGLGCRTQPLRPGCGVSQGLIAFEGREALRGVFKDTVCSDEDLTSEVEQIRDLIEWGPRREDRAHKFQVRRGHWLAQVSSVPLCAYGGVRSQAREAGRRLPETAEPDTSRRG